MTHARLRSRPLTFILSPSGFTLVELVVVLFLLSLMAGLVLPALGRGIEAVELRAQVAGLSAFLRYGREQAVTKRVAHEIRIDRVAHRLTLIPAGAESPKAQRQLSSRIRFSADAPPSGVVTFSPEGFSSGASFRLEAPSGRAYRVTVDPFTGRVTNTPETG